MRSVHLIPKTPAAALGKDGNLTARAATRGYIGGQIRRYVDGAMRFRNGRELPVAAHPAMVDGFLREMPNRDIDPAMAKG